MPAAHEDKAAKNIINSALAAAKIQEIKKADYSNISLRKMVSTLSVFVKLLVAFFHNRFIQKEVHFFKPLY